MHACVCAHVRARVCACVLRNGRPDCRQARYLVEQLEAANGDAVLLARSMRSRHTRKHILKSCCLLLEDLVQSCANVLSTVTLLRKCTGAPREQGPTVEPRENNNKGTDF
jgi:hypothetical protein